MALVGRIFGSKANLWNAVVEHLAERQLHHLEKIRLLAVQADSHPRDAIIGFIRLFADISYEMPEFPAFLIQEASNPGDRLTKLSDELVGPFSASSKPIIAKAQAAGVIVAPNERLFFGMLTSAVSLPMVAPSVFCGASKLTLKLKKEIAEQAIAMFVQALPA
jgi:AcrR family transcriptional regulator